MTIVGTGRSPSRLRCLSLSANVLFIAFFGLNTLPSMTKRICYTHVGPHKTGNTSIQWFLQENRAELLAHGYFVPESETKRGAHHALAEGLAGLDVGEHRKPLVVRSIAAIAETPARAIIISSEALEGLFRNRQKTAAFFNRIQELNLQPKLILFPRNQPQWINSSYCQTVKTFRRSDSFEPGAFGFAQSPDARFSRWIQLAETHGAELIARPFNKETLHRGVVPDFFIASASPPHSFEIAPSDAMKESGRSQSVWPVKYYARSERK